MALVIALYISNYLSALVMDSYALPLQVDIELIHSLLCYICEQSGGSGEGGSVLGAVLVFLPGWDEIMRLKDRLEASPAFGSSR